jgi:hypothetical protein
MLATRDRAGFLVEDSQGCRVGLVEAPMYGNSSTRPDALAVRARRRFGQHFIVPTGTIETIDDATGTISLHVARDELRTFL